MNDYVKETEDKFLSQWEAKRRNQRKIYFENFLIWGIVVSNLVYFFSIDFKLANFNLRDYLLRFVVYSVGSVLLAKIKIRTHKRQYRKIMEKRDQETSGQ